MRRTTTSPAGEAPGRWLGRGLDAVGLDGKVEAEQLRRVLAGDDPATGERLAKHPARKNPGFDLTFRAPKSVSLVWAFADPDVAAQVVAAHDAAVTRRSGTWNARRHGPAVVRRVGSGWMWTG